MHKISNIVQLTTCYSKLRTYSQCVVRKSRGSCPGERGSTVDLNVYVDRNVLLAVIFAFPLSRRK